MTPEQKAAFIFAQAAAALAEIEGMKADNAEEAWLGHSPKYRKKDFDAVGDNYIIYHNAVCKFFYE